MSAARILILGATGGLGRALLRHFSARNETTIWGRTELDFDSPARMADTLMARSFDVLINAAGMTSPDVCETRPEQAQMANVTAPRILAECCQARGAHLIHFSTDYVFSGEPHDRWREEDVTRPVNVYGRTKRDGELAVLNACPGAVVARVSWLFGPDKPSHPDNIIQRALLTDEVAAVADKYSIPTSTADVCAWTECLMRARAAGIWHLCNSGSATWHSWAEAALQVAERLGLPVKTTRVEPVTLASLKQFKAQRPVMTVMSNARLQTMLGNQIRHWSEALEEYLVQKYQPQ